MSDTLTIKDLHAAFENDPNPAEKLPPIHPGEILREDFLPAYGLSAGAVARAVKVPRTRIERIVNEEIGISTDTALRLGRLFGNSPQFWLNLQTRFETESLMPEIGSTLDEITPATAQAA